MSRIARNFFLPILIGAAVFSWSESASAQTVKAEAEKPLFDDLESPQFSGGKQKAFKPKNWLEIEAKIKLAMSPEPASQTADKVMVRWFVAVKNPDKANTYLLLTKDVEHVNVPLNEDVYISIYLSPSSIKRLTGSDRAGKSIVELVGYEVLVNGSKVAEETNKSKSGWWNSASPSISRSDTVPLLTKPQTPFGIMWWDRYAEVVQPNAR
jgi:hypothetical protein